MSWGAEWPPSVLLIAKNAIDALSALSLQLVPLKRQGCAVVSAGAVSATIPIWIEAWNPRRIFCAYDTTPDGEDAAQRLLRKDVTAQVVHGDNSGFGEPLPGGLTRT